MSTPIARRGATRRHVAFPLGGIGTGSLSLDGSGRLRDLEIFNRPSRGFGLAESGFVLWTRSATGETATRALAGPLDGDRLARDVRARGAGLAHMRDATFIGRFPFASVDLEEPDFPVVARIEAWSPFIPLEPDDSGLPTALFDVVVHNPAATPLDVRLYARLADDLGYPDVVERRIEPLDTPGLRGVAMRTTGVGPTSARYGTMTLASPWPDTRIQTHGAADRWFDRLSLAWDEMASGSFTEDLAPAVHRERSEVATIALSSTIAAGATVRLPVWITWHVPNYEKYWAHWWGVRGTGGQGSTWRNHYATRFDDATAVAAYVHDHHDRLRTATQSFADALWSVTVPDAVMDAVVSGLSTLRTPTVARLEDGTFYGWEGCDPNTGSCEGTCTHVWAYAYAPAYLFPTLERSARDAEYRHSLGDDGHMAFRLSTPIGIEPDRIFHAAADGQLAGVVRVYREWQQSGDDAWLADLWPRVKRSLEYAWVAWDQDRDGVPEGLQHTTYDIELFGPNPLVATMYLVALRAAAVIAERVGDPADAVVYRELADRGRTWIDANLFDGEYYVQDTRPDAAKGAPFPPTWGDPVDVEPRYQVGIGCLSDQLIGQWHAWIVGLGDIVDPQHAGTAISSIVRYNVRSEMRGHANPQRVFAVEDDGGLLLATWPKGGRPTLPMPYSDEVWTGIEYEVAALAIYAGLIDDGVRIVEAARRRYDGSSRDPWSEVEAGDHYARGMASYALLLALSGLRYTTATAALELLPAVAPDGPTTSLISVGSGWGTVRETRSPRSIEVHVEAGTLPVATLRIRGGATTAAATLGDASVEAAIQSDADGVVTIRFDGTQVARPGAPLRVVLAG